MLEVNANYMKILKSSFCWFTAISKSTKLSISFRTNLQTSNVRERHPGTFHDIHGRMDGWTDEPTDGWSDFSRCCVDAKNPNTAIAPNLTYLILVTFSPYETQFTAKTYSSKSSSRWRSVSCGLEMNCSLYHASKTVTHFLIAQLTQKVLFCLIKKIINNKIFEGRNKLLIFTL